jgi:hypothetical protein
MADGADGMADYNGEAKIILAKLRLYWRRLMLIIKVYYLSAAKKKGCVMGGVISRKRVSWFLRKDVWSGSGLV